MTRNVLYIDFLQKELLQVNLEIYKLQQRAEFLVKEISEQYKKDIQK